MNRRMVALTFSLSCVVLSAGCLRSERSCSTTADCFSDEVCSAEGLCVLEPLVADPDPEGDAGSGERDTGREVDAGSGGDEDMGARVDMGSTGCASTTIECNGGCCPNPDNGEAICRQSGCDFECDSGYMKCEVGSGCCIEPSMEIIPDETLATGFSQGFEGNDVELVIDGQRRVAHAFYTIASEFNAYHSGLRYRRFEGNAWGAEVRVDPQEGSGRQIAAAVDSQGTVHVVWLRRYVLDADLPEGVYYARFVGGQWTQPLLVSTPDTGVAGDIAVDEQDVVHIGYADVIGNKRMARVRRIKDGSFLPDAPGDLGKDLNLVTHDNGSTRVALAPGASSGVHIVYPVTDSAFGYRTMTDGTLGQEALLTTSTTLGVEVSVVPSRVGQLSLIYESSEGCLFGATLNVSNPLSSFSSDEYDECNSIGDPPMSSHAAVWDGDVVRMSFYQRNGVGVGLRETTWLGGSGWSGSIAAATGGQVGTASSVALDGAGRAYVLFNDTSAGGRIRFEALD